MTKFTSAMAYTLFVYAQEQNMQDVTQEYCKQIIKGTPAMSLINPGNNTTTDNLIEKFNNEEDNNDEAKGNDC